MTYFETPQHAAAYYAGRTLDQQDAHENALEVFAETYGEADLDVEDRRYIDESHIETVTAQDRADLETVLAWEEFQGFGR